jgi:hypothetical protein
LVFNEVFLISSLTDFPQDWIQGLHTRQEHSMSEACPPQLFEINLLKLSICFLVDEVNSDHLFKMSLLSFDLLGWLKRNT